ncbi:MAG: threonine--tRNA ligase [Synergistetes bacterium]|nr:threonine--tRNA ligase [Synergistota bacterium]
MEVVVDGVRKNVQGDRVKDIVAKDTIVVRVGGELKDLDTPLRDGMNIQTFDFDSEEGKAVFWHSTAHLMAQAIKRLYPSAMLAIGPSIENGFYYDIDVDTPITSDSLGEIESEMRRIVKENLPIQREEMSVAEARKLFEERGEKYKIELLDEIEDEVVSVYRQGEFVDLCRGPHLPSTGKIKAFKLLSVAGAYWRGDERNKMLQRIYGISFPTKEMLDEYIKKLEEAKRRDHRKIGKELDLFSFHPEGPGFPFFHPKGMVVWNALIDYWRKVHKAHGYLEVRTPLILNKRLWEQSGHWDHYRENMYFTKIDDEDYAIKPMNCPGGILIFKSGIKSYKDLPLRMAELGLVHRHERSGVLHGLMRVRAFTQDDAHLFVRENQIEEEVIGVIRLADEFYRTFGFKYKVELSTRPENSMGSDEIWEKATSALRGALEKLDMDFEVKEGDGAFYGPKIDFHLEDCIGRTWQCGTIQLDFLMPEKFDLTYVEKDGSRVRPVMLHRTIMGSIERFMGILIEHYAGAFPLWLAPVQIVVIPVGEKHRVYAEEVAETLKGENLRVEVDARDEKLGYRIRYAQVQQVPYMVVVGDKEMQASTLSVRERRKGDLGSLSLGDFLSMLKKENSTVS